MRTFAVLSALLLLASVVGAATLTTKDGLALDLSAQGRVTALRLGATPLALKAEGGLSVCDYARPVQVTNLVPNGSFEDGLTGWRLAPTQTMDSTVAHSGKNSIRLHVPGPEPAKSNLEVIIPVKPNTQYQAELWVRRQEVGVCGAYLSERDDSYKTTGPVGQMGAAIPRRDGEWLQLKWKATTQPKTTRLSLRADIYNSTGTLWVDDYSISEVHEGTYAPVAGTTEWDGKTATVQGEPAGMGLRLASTLRAEENCVRVDGVVSDLTGNDRAVGVRFSLPLDLAGWTWWDDADERQEISQPTLYRRTYNCVSGIRHCSVYPWSAVSSQTNGGLSLAIPLSQGPRVFILQHDQAAQELSLTFFFGLTKLAAKHPSSAPFSFVIYRHDPRWGMRSAMERYYQLFPESFQKRPGFEGYLNYANLEVPTADHALSFGKTRVPDVSDFGEGYKFLFHVHGCYDFRQVAYDDPKLPPDETVMQLLQQMAQSPNDPARGYTPTTETIKKICRGAKGEILYIGDTKYWRAQEGYNHTDKPGWGFNFFVNEDPGVSPHLENVSRAKAEEYAKTTRRPWDATFTADAIEGYESNQRQLNFNPEHFKTTTFPLTFGAESLKPGMPNSIYDFLKNSWWPITQQYQIVTYGNANGYEQAFTLPYVDIPMTEGDWDQKHPARLDRYMRALAHHKIWRYWRVWDEGNQYGETNPTAVRGQLLRGLAYGIYPCVWGVEVCTANLEQFRELYRQHVPALEELNCAGWEPVPYATPAVTSAGDAELTVERFGSYPAGELHYTLRLHSGGPVKGDLKLDRPALGIPENTALVYRDLLHGQLAPLPPSGLPVDMSSGGVMAVWIGTREQAAQQGFRLATRLLEKIDRTFYPEMDAPSRQSWEAAVRIAQQGQRATGQQALILAQSLQNALTSLQQTIPTKSPVDLAKLIFRTRVATAMAPAALLKLSLQGQAPTIQPRRGAKCDIATVLNGGLAELRAEVLSPWTEVAAGATCRVEADKPMVQTVTASLILPADPPRALLPYLIKVSGSSGGQAVELYAPVDIVPGSPLSASVLPLRAFRGQERRLTLTFRNALDEAAELQVKLTPPAKTTLAPTEFALNLPAKGEAEQVVMMKLDPMTFLGTGRIGYTVTSSKPQFNTAGTLDLTVSDPVPQLPIRSTPTPPVIDGTLDDAAWQQPPLLPELRLLANGGPATEKTSVWTTYDGRGLYVAFRCAESQMDKLVAKYGERGDPLYLDDDVELFIFAPGVARTYQLAVNALGTRSDNFGNKADWQAAAQRGPAEWTVEVFIPYEAVGQFRQAGIPAGTVWGMQFGRQQKAKRETTSWTPGQSFIDKTGFARSCSSSRQR